MSGVFKHLSLKLVVALTWIPTFASAEVLTTTFVGGNGFDGNMFDVVAKNDVTITSFDVNTDADGDFEVYTKTGSYVGFETDSLAWTLLATVSVTNQGQGNPTPLGANIINVPIVAGNRQAFYVTATTTGVTYSNGSVEGALFVEDANLQFFEGVGKSYPFGSTPRPRVFNGNIIYNLSGGGGFGDPHLKTWNGQRYEYHGECDLILASSQIFANNLGLDIHIRTTIRDDWSYISAAALRIGADILEVQSFGKYYLNGVENAPIPKNFAGFRVAYNKANRKNRPDRFLIYTHQGKIEIRVYNDFVAVYIKNPKSEGFEGAVGLMGSFSQDSAWLLRDGETVATEPSAFAAEWQVRDYEHQLFVNEGTVTHPEPCRLPTVTEEERRHRRLEESSISYEMAEEACKDWTEDKDSCIGDILLTGDLGMAMLGAF